MQVRLKTTKDDLMNRLNNALKQRDAAREENLVQAEKLSKLQARYPYAMQLSCCMFAGLLQVLQGRDNRDCAGGY